MKIEFMAYKGDKEQILYAYNNFLLVQPIEWPESSLYYTNNFDAGSEFVRLSELEDYDFLFNQGNGQLLFVQTPFSSGFCNVPGKTAFTVEVKEDYGEQYKSADIQAILDELVIIRNIVEGETASWP